MQKTEEAVLSVQVTSLVASPWNRAEDGNGEMQELVESIRSQGVLQPLIVRTNQEGAHEIVAGHRRWRAAEAAGLKEVPCLVRGLNDEEARQVQIIENLHRKNLNPMEEATAFVQLIQSEKFVDHKDIAMMVGKDVKYVHRALRLLQLPKPVQVAIEKGLLSAAHGHQLVRVGEKQLDGAVKFCLTKDYHGNYATVQDLKSFIANKVSKSLAEAYFPLDVEYAGKIACKGCPHNSRNQSLLFDGAENGQCTNGPCYTTKTNAALKEIQEEGAKKWPELKFLGTASQGYGTQAIKGYAVVKVDAKVKAAMKKNPEKFGYGIIKPSAYGEGKLPTLVVCTSDAKVSGVKRDRENGGYVAPTPEQQAAQQFSRKWVEGKESYEVYTKGDFGTASWYLFIEATLSDEWGRGRYAGYMKAAALDPEKPIGPQLVNVPKESARVLAMCLLAEGNTQFMDATLKASGINFKKYTKVWQKEMQSDWDKVKVEYIAQFKKEQANG